MLSHRSSMHRLLLAAPVVIVAGLAIVATIEIWHPSGPTENVTVAAALTKHRSRGHTVTEAEVRSAYETMIHHGLSAEIVSICVAGDWNECAEFRSDEEEAISVAHKVKGPLGSDVSSQELRESYRAFIAHGVSPVQARKCLVFFNPAHCPL